MLKYADRGRMVGPGRSQEIYAGSFATQGAKDKLIKDLNELAVSTQRAGGGNPIALFNLANILAGDLQKKEAPEAYLIYALGACPDECSDIGNQDSNRYEVGKKVLTKNAANQHEVLEENMYISKDGYMETFVVNETSEDVWFDNMMVMSISSVIVQETHYDPWGLELNGLGFQYGGIKANKFLYNGKELIEDNGLQYYDYGARMYDPVIGRWGVVDPLADQRSWVSPYNFVQNNPLNRIDPDGRLDWVANREGEVYWDENATSQATTKTNETYLGKSGTGIDEKTGNTLVYNSDGSIDQGMMSLGEVTVSATQSDHERTMSSPVVQNMRANSDRIRSEALPFARHMVRSAIDGAGYTGAGITAVGTVVTPFVPHIGFGLLAVGASVSSASGYASAGMNMLEGDLGSAAIDAGMIGLGSVGSKSLKLMKNRSLINTTDETVLKSIYNSSMDILGIGIVPAIKK